MSYSLAQEYSSLDFGFSAFFPEYSELYKELRNQKGISIQTVWGIIDGLGRTYNERLQNCEEYNQGYHQAFDRKHQVATAA